jgi:putative phage-type endonuclease
MKSYKKVPNINARDFATILGVNPYQSAYELLEEKIEKKHPFFGNKFTEHGNRYENIAIKSFEELTGNRVDSNQSNTSHPEYDWITGRVDGLFNEEVFDEPTNLSRKRKRSKNNKLCVLEVKCPLKTDRIEPLTEQNVPMHYWCQCQVYLNMIGCDNVYYVEYYIRPNDNPENAKLYYVKIKKDMMWWEESLVKIKKFYEEMKKYHLLGNLETHPVRISEKIWKITLLS